MTGPKSFAVLVAVGLALSGVAFAQTPKGNFVSGSASATDGNAHTIIAAPTGSMRIYVTGVQCGRTDAGTTASRVTLNDDASTVLVLSNAGNGGGNNLSFGNAPLTVPRATALTFTSSASISTVFCSAQGYQGN
jgi:hypothetical protein